MSETAQRPVSHNGSGPVPTGSDRPVDPDAPAGGFGGFGDNPWVRRGGSVLVLLVAAAIFAYGCNVGQSADSALDDDAIVAQFPAPGGRALRQTEVGAQLALGYDGRLSVNGIQIPEEQLEGALDPNDPALRRQIEQYGVRSNNRERVVFRPGPGKVIESFEQGEVQITLTYFPAGFQDTDSRTTTWTISVS
jgi:hypothetical protein